MIDKPLTLLSREELKDYIFRLQKFIQDEQESGKDIDTILDETDIFDEFDIISLQPKYTILSPQPGESIKSEELCISLSYLIKYLGFLICYLF